jgi:hypothetical protein
MGQETSWRLEPRQNVLAEVMFLDGPDRFLLQQLLLNEARGRIFVADNNRRVRGVERVLEPGPVIFDAVSEPTCPADTPALSQPMPR